MRWIAIVSLVGSLAINAGEPIFKDPFELGFTGIPILKVVLFAKDGSSKELRMMLDTGSSITILDRKVGSELWSKDGEAALAEGASGGTMEVEPIRMHRLQCGPWSMKRVQGIRMDLGGVNRVQDVPVDGIIGMNVLREGPFRLDFAVREIEWGGKPEGASLLDLIYTERGLPILRLDVAGKRIDALCDTGSSGTLDLSDNDAERLLKTSDRRTGGSRADINGVSSSKMVVELSVWPVSAGSKTWCDPEVLFRKGTPDSSLGVNAMWPRIWFDFRRKQIGFMVGKGGCLESKPGIKLPIHAIWDRTKTVAKLLVIGVKPGSAYETCGIKGGDILIEVGDLKGDALNLASLRQALSGEKILRVIIERQGQFHTFEAPTLK
jgi:hypothetical protein